MTIGRSQAPYNCFAKLFCTWSSEEKFLRLGRVVWRRGRLMHGGYTAKLSLALTPRLFRIERGFKSLAVTTCGIRLHYKRSYGGWTA